jgi:arylsulfatase A-like enzyme
MPTENRPNVIIFIPHDLGDTLHCYGHPDVRSPNLDAMAERGVMFDNYFTAAAECTPSRVCAFTGLYTHQTGLMGLTHLGWEFDPDAVHLAQMLYEGGYDTHLFGFQHETALDPRRLGYNHAHSQSERDVASVCDSLVSFLGSDEAHGDRPWFAHAGFFDVHRPWQAETSFDPEDVLPAPYLPDLPEAHIDFARFYQNILDMDTAIGRVLDALAESDLAEETLVIFTTDHGAPFPRAKSTFFDPGIHIPLIMHWPGHIEGGAVHDELLSNIDLTPTLLEITGCEAPHKLEGRSFRPLLAEGSYEEREAIFGVLYYDRYYDPMHYVRTNRYKYIRSYGITEADAFGAEPDTLASHKCGIWIRSDDTDVQSSLTWQAMRGESFPKPPPEELYDLEVDPLEQKNLIDDPAYRQVLADLQGRLHNMMRWTRSPLLIGHVPPDLSRTRNEFT